MLLMKSFMMVKIVLKSLHLFSFFFLKFYIFVLNKLRKICIIRISDIYLLNLRTSIQNNFQQIIDSTYIATNPVGYDVGLTYVDIGARDGLPEVVAKNRKYFRTIVLCEGEKKEAEKLKRKGFLVIDKFLSDKKGPAKFYYINKHEGASSIFKPGTPFLDLFSPKHHELYTNFEVLDIHTSTLESELELLDLNKVHFMKLDVQGAELSIIKTLNQFEPLFWEVEVLPLPTYEGAPYGTNITTEITRRGYICFRHNERLSHDGMYIYSNEIYMPDYTRSKGADLIEENLDEWLLMMEIFDLKGLSLHILKNIRSRYA